MESVYITLFFAALFLLIYIYLGYPAVLFILSLFKRKPDEGSLIDYMPSVTLIIPARNEEKVIVEKIKNCQKLTYPKEKLEILILSDQSTDRTVELVKQYSDDQIKLLELTKRHGKTAAQNKAAEWAGGKILVFSDANAMYEPDALEQLVKHFEDPTVGCVCGELCYSNSADSTVGKEEGLYWQYEKFIKRHEDRFFSIIGANGSIYAIRKSNYVPLDENVISDFIEPLEIVHDGKKAVYEATAISIEDSSKTFDEELKRKRRIISRSLYSLSRHRHLINPFRSIALTFEILSHKVLRWMSPIFQGLLLISNLFLLDSLYFRTVFLLQAIFYLLSWIGFAFRNSSQLPSLIYLPFYFNLINYASLMGIWDWMRKKHAVVWDPIR